MLSDIAIIEDLGISVSYSRAAAVDFLDWFLCGEADPESASWQPTDT